MADDEDEDNDDQSHCHGQVSPAFVAGCRKLFPVSPDLKNVQCSVNTLSKVKSKHSKDQKKQISFKNSMIITLTKVIRLRRERTNKGIIWKHTKLIRDITCRMF